jgi:pSer/pThr/pTyr-binding forkhead associated (FHA) protein
MPDVDLEACGALRKGVSRVHAVIKRREGNFLVEDLGSTNGTYLNWHRLKPNEPYPIANGNEIRLGEEINAPPGA